MAISALTVWEVRASGAADTAGGGFVAGSGGTDRSQQNAAQVAVGGGVVTSSVTTTTITFTGGTYTVLAGDVGNIVQVISGTNTTAGFFQIASVGAGLNGTWVMDRNVVSAGTQTDLVANMGGALATLSKLSGAMLSTGSNKAYVTGAFTSTATTTFAQTVTPTPTAPPTRLIGYGATRGDSTHATLTLGTNTGLTGILCTGNGVTIEKLDVDCASLGTSTAISQTGTFSEVRNCKVANFTTKGINIAGQNAVIECEATGGTAAATGGAIAAGSTSFHILRCFVHDNACPGIIAANVGSVAFNIVANNSGASSDGIVVSNFCLVRNNTVHNNGRHGIILSATNLISNLWRDNILSNNGGYGLVGSGGASNPADPDYDGNAFFSNTSGTRNLMDLATGIYSVNPYVNVRDVILTVSPYVGGTTGTTANFALNNTAGGGAACRAAGSPGTFLGNTGTTSYLDMGAVQTRGSSSSPNVGTPGIITPT